MSDAPTANAVADLLSRSAAQDVVGGIRVPMAGHVPIATQYGVGEPGSSGLTGAWVPLIIGGVLVSVSLIVAVNVLLVGDPSMNGIMGIILPLFIAAFIAGPAIRKMRKGTLQWTRLAEVHADWVSVTDTSGTGAVNWVEPISGYRDIFQGFHWVPSPDGEGDGLELEVVLLRHPDAAKTIYVSGTRKTTMGGMSFLDMVQAGREGRQDDVVAAVGDTRNPEVETLVAELAELTGLAVSKDFD